jgi:hypothetical protein
MPVYLPMIAIVTCPSGLRTRSLIMRQVERSGGAAASIPKAASTSLSNPSA